MSIKEKDLDKAGSDIVKSSLAKAYEDGVDGLGNKPEETRILEDVIGVKSNSVNDFENLEGPDTGTSSQINNDKYQKIASFQLDLTELDDIYDLLDANHLEACLDKAIVSEIIAFMQTVDNLNGKINSMRENAANDLQSIDFLLGQYYVLFKQIQKYASFLAKGNIIKNTETWARAHTTNLMSKDGFDEIFWRENTEMKNGVRFLSPEVLIAGKALGFPGFLEKINSGLDGTTSGVETLSEFTTSALLAQSMINAQVCLDHGVPMSFMAAADPSDSNSLDGHLSAAAKYTQNKSKYYSAPVSLFTVGSKDFPALRDLFDYTYANSYLIRPENTKSAISTPEVLIPVPSESSGENSAITGKFWRNPIYSLPRLEKLSLVDSVAYLSTIIDREITVSHGLSYTLKTAQLNVSNVVRPEVADKIKNGHIPMSRITTTIGEDAGHGLSPAGRPGDRIYGGLLLTDVDAFYANATPWTMAHEFYTKGIGYGMQQLRLPLNPGSTHVSAFNPNVHQDSSFYSVMPFEGAHPDDEDFGEFLVNPKGPIPDTSNTDGSVETLRSGVIDRIMADPTSIKDPVAFHKDVTAKVAQRTSRLHTLTDSLTMVGVHKDDALNYETTLPNYFTDNNSQNVHTKGKNCLSKLIISCVIEHIGEMMETAARSNTFNLEATHPSAFHSSKQSICDFFALKYFLRPLMSLDSKTSFLKSRYVKRLCEFDVTRHFQALPGVSIIPGQPIALNYSPPSGRLKHASVFINETKTKYSTAAYPLDTTLTPEFTLGEGEATNFETVADVVGDGDFGAGTSPASTPANFTTNYFDIENPHFRGDHEAAQHMHTEAVFGGMAGGQPDGGYTPDFLKTCFFMGSLFKNLSRGDSGNAVFVHGNLKTNGEYSKALMSGYDIINMIFGPYGGSEHTSLLNFANRRCLMTRIINIADRIEKMTAAKEKSPTQGAGPVAGTMAETTYANGMDRSQLLCYILEIFSLIADDLVQVDGMLGKQASEKSYSNDIYNDFNLAEDPLFQKQMVLSALNFWQGTGTAGSRDHLLILSPKINGYTLRWTNHDEGELPSKAAFEETFAPEIDPVDLGILPPLGSPKLVSVQNPTYTVEADPGSPGFQECISFTTYAKLIRSIGKEIVKDMNRADTSAFPDFVEKVITRIEFEDDRGIDDFPYLFDQGIGGANTDFQLGDRLKLSSIYNMIKAASAASSGYAYCYSPFSDMTKYFKHMWSGNNFNHLTNDFLDELEEQIDSLISDVGIAESTVVDFVKTLSTASIRNARLLQDRYKEITGETDHFDLVNTQSGVYCTSKTQQLNQAVKLALADMQAQAGEDQFVNVVFIGANEQKLRTQSLYQINRDGLLSSGFTDTFFRREFTFSRHSETNTGLSYEQNESHLAPIIIDTSFFPKNGLNAYVKALTDHANSKVSLDNLIDNTVFHVKDIDEPLYKTDGEFDMQERTGAQLISLGTSGLTQVEARAMLKRRVISDLMVYMFESLTGIPVGEDLTYKNKKVISKATLTMFLEGLRQTDIYNFQKDEVIQVGPPEIKRHLGMTLPEFSPATVVEALFEDVPKGTANDQYDGVIPDPIRMKTDPEELAEAFKPSLERNGLEAFFKEPAVSLDLFLIIQALMRSSWLSIKSGVDGVGSLDESVMRSRIFDDVTALVTNKLFDRESFNVIGDDGKAASAATINEANDPSFRLDNYRVFISQIAYKGGE